MLQQLWSPPPPLTSGLDEDLRGRLGQSGLVLGLDPDDVAGVWLQLRDGGPVDPPAHDVGVQLELLEKVAGLLVEDRHHECLVVAAVEACGGEGNEGLKRVALRTAKNAKLFF